MAQLLLDLQSKLNNEQLGINSSHSSIEQECNKRLDSTTLTEKDNEVDMMTESVIKWDTNTKKIWHRLIAKPAIVVNGDLKDMDLVKFSYFVYGLETK